MSLLARILDVQPDPLELASRVVDRPGAALLWTGFGEGRAFVACDPVASSTKLDPEPELGLEPDGGPLAEVPRWIGVLPYECTRGLERPRHALPVDPRAEPHAVSPVWYRYPAVATVADRVLVVGEDAASVSHLWRLLARPARPLQARARLAQPPEPEALHEARVRDALDLISAGDLYQVNLARRFEFDVQGSATALLRGMSRGGFALYAAAFQFGGLAVVSGSPELFLAVTPDGRLVTSPIKGTRPRGADAGSDARLIRELDLDPKENAELAMIMDVERNDLGRVARVGSVRVLAQPHVVTLPTVHHRLATIGARLRSDVTRRELLEATLPSGSVTGAPKIRAMEVIAKLEPARRGLYTGALGMLAHNGGLRLSMAIRTLTVRGGRGHYYSGGGIVADSDPRREVRETVWKAAPVAALDPLLRS